MIEFNCGRPLSESLVNEYYYAVWLIIILLRKQSCI